MIDSGYLQGTSLPFLQKKSQKNHCGIKGGEEKGVTDSEGEIGMYERKFLRKKQKKERKNKGGMKNEEV